jgi:arsenite-transporting ATPase
LAQRVSSPQRTTKTIASLPLISWRCTLSIRPSSISQGSGVRLQQVHSTIGIIERRLTPAGIEVEIVKVEKPDEIRAFGVMPRRPSSSPARWCTAAASLARRSAGLAEAGRHRVSEPPDPASVLHRQRRRRQDLAVHRRGADAGRRGKKVLLVSTDAASNLDEMLGSSLRNTPVPVPGAPGLSVLNIDPDNAAESYRQRVLAQMGASASAEDSRRCASSCPAPAPPRSPPSTSSRPCWPTAPRLRPHRLRHGADGAHLALLSLPKAWTGFLDGNDRGASCLGPHSGLKMQEVRFKAALDALSDPRRPPWSW